MKVVCSTISICGYHGNVLFHTHKKRTCLAYLHLNVLICTKFELFINWCFYLEKRLLQQINRPTARLTNPPTVRWILYISYPLRTSFGGGIVIGTPLYDVNLCPRHFYNKWFLKKSHHWKLCMSPYNLKPFKIMAYPYHQCAVTTENVRCYFGAICIMLKKLFHFVIVHFTDIKLAFQRGKKHLWRRYLSPAVKRNTMNVNTFVWLLFHAEQLTKWFTCF